MERKSKVSKKEVELIEFAGKEVKVTDKEETDFQKQLRQEEEDKAKLPIDRIVDIATKSGLLTEATPEARWETFIKGIRLHDIINDSMQSSMNEFCKEYNKKNPTENLGLKLHLRKDKKENTIFGVTLVLEMRKNDTYTLLQKKQISFQHIRQLKEEASWKYALYGEMYNSLMSFSLTYLILQHDVNTGRIGQEVPA